LEDPLQVMFFSGAETFQVEKPGRFFLIETDLLYPASEAIVRFCLQAFLACFAQFR
jgi:hypothetical protein